MLESYIENKLRVKVKQLGVGAMCLKFESPGCTGVPDRMILLPSGRVIFVELKKPSKKERKRQEYVRGCSESWNLKCIQRWTAWRKSARL